MNSKVIFDRPNSFWTGLNIVTLWGFAVAQPIYDLLAQYPTFLVAHAADAGSLVGFALLVSFIFPVTLASCAWLLGLLGNSIHAGLHHCLVYILISLTISPVLKKQLQPSDPALLLLTLLVSAAFLVAYCLSRHLKQFVTCCSPTIVVFPLVFLCFSPAHKLLLPRAEFDRRDSTAAKRPVPIVLVVFDEFASTFLLDETELIDAVRYPNFAALARDAYWFPNATTVDHSTKKAVPAILTGSYPKGDKLPSIVDYPQNLFTLLDGQYALNAVESVFQLAPEQDGPLSKSDHRAMGLKALLQDVSVVYLHSVSPAYVMRLLPDVTENWGGFMSPDAQETQGNSSGKSCLQQRGPSPIDRRLELYRKFVKSIENNQTPTLHFLHTMFPHVPHGYLPSGKWYGKHFLEGCDRYTSWDNHEWNVTVGMQRYLLQLAFTDRLLGELLEKLKAVGLYDRALVIIMADHGVSFRANTYRRNVTEDNCGDIMSVPLLIKLPHQASGIVSQRRVESIDILPTIADVVGIPVPWDLDGYSILDNSAPERSEATIGGPKESVLRIPYSTLDAQRKESLRHMLTLFGSGMSRENGLFYIGPHKELIGQTIGQDVFPKTSAFRAEIEQQALVQNVDKESAFVPCYIRGWVSGDEAPPKSVVIAINDTIHATACVSGSGRFVSILPVEAFRQGKNEVEVLAVVDQSDDTQLFRTATGPQHGYRLEGSRIFDLDTGESVSADPRALKGFVGGSRVSDDNNVVTISGWAVNVKQGQPVDRVMVFVDGQIVYNGRTSVDRPDVRKKFQNDRFLRSGYEIKLPSETLNKAKDIRIFAASAGVFTELSYTPAARQYLPQFVRQQLNR